MTPVLCRPGDQALPSEYAPMGLKWGPLPGSLAPCLVRWMWPRSGLSSSDTATRRRGRPLAEALVPAGTRQAPQAWSHMQTETAPRALFPVKEAPQEAVGFLGVLVLALPLHIRNTSTLCCES